MNRWDIINDLIKKNNYTKYLEIGVQNNRNFNKIDCPSKVGVDPAHNSNPTFNVTSDEFFKMNQGVYDIIFLDGKHEAEQTYKDIVNSLKVLTPNGTIVVHDCNPASEVTQRVPRETKEWYGDVWRSFVQVRNILGKDHCYVIDADCGCGIIKYKETNMPEFSVDMPYTYFDSQRKELLGLVSPQNIKEKKIMIYEFTPGNIEKNLGKAYNDHCRIVPNDEDWIILRDRDTMVLLNEYDKVLMESIQIGFDVYTCYTNRTKNQKQLYHGIFDVRDLGELRELSIKCYHENKGIVDEIRGDISGHFMMFQKKTWKELGGFAETEQFKNRGTIVGIDTAFSRKIKASGKRIGLIKSFLLPHYYRLLEGVSNREHLK